MVQRGRRALPAVALVAAMLFAASFGVARATTPRPTPDTVPGVTTTAYGLIDVFYQRSDRRLSLRAGDERGLPGRGDLGGVLTSGPAGITIGSELEATWVFARGADEAIGTGWWVVATADGGPGRPWGAEVWVLRRPAASATSRRARLCGCAAWTGPCGGGPLPEARGSGSAASWDQTRQLPLPEEASGRFGKTCSSWGPTSRCGSSPAEPSIVSGDARRALRLPSSYGAERRTCSCAGRMAPCG